MLWALDCLYYISAGLQHHVNPCHFWWLDGPWQGRPVPPTSAWRHSTVDDADSMRMDVVWWMGRQHNLEMARRLLDLKPSKLVEIHMFWLVISNSSIAHYFQPYFGDSWGWSQLIQWIVFCRGSNRPASFDLDATASASWIQLVQYSIFCNATSASLLYWHNLTWGTVKSLGDRLCTESSLVFGKCAKHCVAIGPPTTGGSFALLFFT